MHLLLADDLMNGALISDHRVFFSLHIDRMNLRHTVSLSDCHVERNLRNRVGKTKNNRDRPLEATRLSAL
jgi:hypothetical protein